MLLKKVFFRLFIYLFAAMLVVGFASISVAAKINVGALNDMTGATSDVGKDYALGIAEAIHYVNDNGGINGKKIKKDRLNHLDQVRFGDLRFTVKLV
jgi:branched-chain amino acid transport system substrate-binding protein